MLFRLKTLKNPFLDCLHVLWGLELVLEPLKKLRLNHLEIKGIGFL